MVVLVPDNAEVWRSLSESYAKTGNDEQAAKAKSKADNITENPDLRVH